MYKCIECGTQFDIKPEYCDCGNDKFEEITVSENKHKQQVSFLKRNNISPFALSFFITCIILSVLVLLFFANPEKQDTGADRKTKTVSRNSVSIPDIDTFWNNSAPIPSQNKTKEINQPPVIEVIQIIEKPLPAAKKTAAKTTQKKNNVSKPVKTTVNTPVKTQQKTTTAQTSARELYNYKIQLRNALFSHLSAGSIQGSGKCGIEFALNSNGKLIDRAFTFQSDNKTLNDEVYKMMMRMPTFSPPPKSYNGEKIKITFEFNNGSYEVHLVN